jgi:hypothetical protein
VAFSVRMSFCAPQGLSRVLEVKDEGLFMLMLPERSDLVHTRSVTWRQFANFGYELVFP